MNELRHVRIAAELSPIDMGSRPLLASLAWGSSDTSTARRVLCAFQARLIAVALLVVLAFGAVSPAAAQEKSATTAEKATAAEGMIYPRNAAPADAPTAPGKSGGSNSSLILLACGAAAAGGWFLWRQRHSVNSSGPQARKLAIAESRSLGNRQYLVVADYDGKKFLLGVCPGRIEMLTPLDASSVGAGGAEKGGAA